MKTIINALYKTIALLTVLICLLILVAPKVVAENKYTVYKCQGGGLSIPRCSKQGESSTPVDPTSANNPIIAWMAFFINLLSVIIVLGGSVMLAIAGVQYSASRDNAQAVQAAKQRIYNVIIGLLMYAFFYGFMQWLVPGGVF